ncbi:hypothetical protein [Staphylococcus epidermidis]|uniref:hypothetical protein n=1 Tax=Staphylococcus epidermidis TaxID=1282 RepID=UPI001642E581
MILRTADNVAEEVGDEVVKAGVKGIVKFRGGGIKRGEEVEVDDIEFGIELE